MKKLCFILSAVAWIAFGSYILVHHASSDGERWLAIKAQPQEPFVAQLNSAGKRLGLDWKVYDYPHGTSRHDWTAVAYPKGVWKPWCKEDGGTDLWYVQGYQTPQEAAAALLRILSGNPNIPAEPGGNFAEGTDAQKVKQFTDPREWSGN